MCSLCVGMGRIAIVAAYFLLGLVVVTAAITTWPSDRDALVAFKESLSAGVPANWTGDPCAGWQGVTCSEQGRVTQLSLDLQGLRGRIPGQLGTLSELTYLSLENNQLDGPIPPELGSLIKLTNLGLAQNNLTGSIPAQLGNLSNVLYLSLSTNRLTGPIPAEMGNLTALTFLDLRINNLSGPIPPQLGQLRNLEYLILTSNRLTGAIPEELGTFPVLLMMYLDSNNLTGSIPPVLGNLSNMTTLNLARNNLTGAVPPELAACQSLNGLSLNSNHLSGTIPPELGSLSRLTFFGVFNNSLSGTIPVELTRLSKLRNFDLSVNNLNGTIPSEVGSLSALVSLQLYSNRLTGRIPASLGNLPNLTTLLLNDNYLSEGLPEQLGNLSNLITLDAHNNNLTGPIPGAAFAGLSSLKRLILSNNRFNGPVPGELSRLQSNLETLDLSHNSLAGRIPDQLGTFNALTTMNLSLNTISGPIPGTLRGLRTVTTLDLSRNNLSDSIPAELGTLSVLTILDLSHNDITGPIPGQLGNLQLKSLSLSKNFLTGGIPVELGNLKGVLDLSHNNLSGRIPDNVNWDQESDLSDNFLNGVVPERLANSGLALNCLTLESGDYSTNGQRNSTECSQQYPGVLCVCASPKVLGLDGLCHCVTPLEFQALFMAQDRQSLGNFTANLINTLRELAAVALVTDRQVAFVKSFQSFSPPSVKLDFNILPLARSSFSAEQESAIRANLSATTNVTVPFFNQGFKLLSASPVVSSSRDVKRIVTAVGTSSLVALLLASLVLLMLWRRHTLKSRSLAYRFNMPDTAVKSLLLSDLKRATDNFNESNWIGKGAFGDVYKGDLNGTPVAIKKLKVGSHQGWEEFEKELTTIGSIHNRNLVKLLGCCVNGEELLLVYEFMANGSLQDALFKEGGLRLDWDQSKNIMVGTARAIAYLHGGCSPKIIHRDIKPANILIDDNFEAKVSDFGLARMTSVEDVHVSTSVKGTWGYMAPDYHTTRQLTEKSDVYSYGMVMLVVISQSGLWSTIGESAIGIRWKAFRLMQEGRELELLAPRFADAATQNETRRFISVALLCVHPIAQLRPSMENVVQMLRGTMDIPPMNTAAIEAYVSMENQSMSSGESSTGATAPTPELECGLTPSS